MDKTVSTSTCFFLHNGNTISFSTSTKYFKTMFAPVIFLFFIPKINFCNNFSNQVSRDYYYGLIMLVCRILHHLMMYCSWKSFTSMHTHDTLVTIPLCSHNSLTSYENGNRTPHFPQEPSVQAVKLTYYRTTILLTYAAQYFHFKLNPGIQNPIQSSKLL